MTPEMLDRAEGLRRAKKFPELAIFANDILANDPNDVDALFMAGQSFLFSGRNGLAYSFFSRAAGQQKKNPQIWHQMASCLTAEHQVYEARRFFEKVIQLAPDHGKAMVNLSALMMQAGDPHAALFWANKALAIDPEWADAKYNAATAHLLLGNWGQGWDWFDYGLDRKARVMRRAYNHNGGPDDWDGSPGKNIVVYGEQGIGDEVMLAAMLPDVQRNAKTVILDCDSRLEGLFKRSFPGIEVHGTRFQNEIDWPEGREIDARCAMASLGRFYRRKAEDFPGTPYLKADPERKTQWRALLDTLPGKLKVGIAWTGGLPDTFEKARSLKLEALLPVLSVPGVDFVSLQYKDCREEIEAFERDHGVKVHHWRRATEAADYDETAGLVDELDLVIAVMTSVCHLAGALGKECWTLVPRASNWRWGMKGSTVPWAKSVKVFRQGDNWPIQQIAAELKERVGAHVV